MFHSLRATVEMLLRAGSSGDHLAGSRRPPAKCAAGEKRSKSIWNLLAVTPHLVFPTQWLGKQMQLAWPVRVAALQMLAKMGKAYLESLQEPSVHSLLPLALARFVERERPH